MPSATDSSSTRAPGQVLDRFRESGRGEIAGDLDDVTLADDADELVERPLGQDAAARP
ncbi:MAG: hypothetical protein MZU84_08470 [Sphingobacterium sp.]|nr:hypothetical protein [Sphingobacterium sp.]